MAIWFNQTATTRATSNWSLRYKLEIPFECVILGEILWNSIPMNLTFHYHNLFCSRQAYLAGGWWCGLQYFNIIIYKDANLNIFCGIENGTPLDTQILNSNLFSIDWLIQLKRIPGQPIRDNNLVLPILGNTLGTLSVRILFYLVSNGTVFVPVR